MSSYWTELVNVRNRSKQIAKFEKFLELPIFLKLASIFSTYVLKKVYPLEQDMSIPSGRRFRPSLGAWKNYCWALWRCKAVGFTTLENLVFLGLCRLTGGVCGSSCRRLALKTAFEILKLSPSIIYSHLILFRSRRVESVEKASNWQARTLYRLISLRFYKNLHNSKINSSSGMSHSSLLSFS